MNLNYKVILFIVIISSAIGFVYNVLNPKGISLIKEERVLIFDEDENSDSTDLLESRPNEIPLQKTDDDNISPGINSIIEESNNQTPEPFKEPVAIRLSRAYQLFQQGILFIDSRSKEEYADGHIKGAVNIPFYESDKYEEVLAKIDKNQIVVTYCSGADCDTSILHGDELFEKGYKRVYIFYGGWNDWLDAGYPIESSN